MGVKIYKKPRLKEPVLIACWSGIGNIGIIAVDTLRELLMAEELGEIEPWDFFYPRSVLIEDGVLKDLEFPSNKFYFARTDKRDLIFFIGEEQPSVEGRLYARGEKAYQMANLVLDVAQKFACRRIYTSGAAVAPIHHTMKPRVLIAPTSEELIKEAKQYKNVILMSEMEGRGQGKIIGLNGLLLGVAKERGLPGFSIMGEIPVYLQGAPLPYPKASKSVLEVLTSNLEIKVDLSKLDELAQQVDRRIEEFYELIPQEIRERIDQLKYLSPAEPIEPKPITEEDKKKIMEDIDKFFKGGKGHKEAL
jgi:hypothetical protein